MKLNLSDNKVIALLLVALILQILLLLWHMDLIGSPSKNEMAENGVPAGTIESIENSLKRRPLDSLIWEESRAPEKIYFHDSVLTLSESTANILLKNGTQIKLSENTLITIEPEQSNASGEIRIRMAQGNLRTRNPYKKAIINDQTTSVRIEADSDVDLAKNQQGQVEVLVNKGKADVVFNDKAYAVVANEKVIFNKTGVSKNKVSQELQWESPSLLRVYTHKEQSTVPLQWHGSATEIVILKEGEPIKAVQLTTGQQKATVDLPLGTYFSYLKGIEGLSKNRELQVWAAPKVQLVLPRPRDRKKTGALQFIWTPHNKIQSYELVVSRGENIIREPIPLNKTTKVLESEGDFLWEVWGVDQKGFKIPPAYSNPLFIRENPFAPPKLKKPKIIESKPTPKTSRWSEILVPKAWALEKKTAVFTWEEVSGAEIYFIEISKDKEFRNPLVKVELSSPVFQWTNFDETATYYWRVAAGDRSGRMGLFTEPAVVDWDYVLANPNKMVKPKATTAASLKIKKRKVKTVKALKPVEKPVEKIEKKSNSPEKAVSQPPLPPRKIFKSASFFYQPGYGLKNFKENGQTKAKLSGFSPLSFGLETQIYLSRSSVLRWYSKFYQLEYEPEPKSAFPFQPNVKTQTWVNHLSWSPQTTAWGFGFWLANLPTLKRQSFEQVGIEQEWSYGISVDRTTNLSSVQWVANFAMIAGNNQWGGSTSQRFLYPILLESLKVGMEIEVIYLNGDAQSTLLMDSYLLLGWEF